MKLKNTLNWILITISVMILTACGGGGSTGASQLPSASVSIVDPKQSYSAGEVIYFTTSTVQDTNVTVTYGNGQTLKSILTDDGSYVTMLPVDLVDGTQSLTFDLGENNDTIDLLLQSTPFTADPYEFNLAILTKLRDELIIESATLAGDELAFVETQISELENSILELDSLSDEDQLALAKILSLHADPLVVSQAPSLKTTSIFLSQVPNYAISEGTVTDHSIGLVREVAASASLAGVIALTVTSGATGIAAIPAGIAAGYLAVKWAKHTKAALGHAKALLLYGYDWVTSNDSTSSLSKVSSLQRLQSISSQTATFNHGVAQALSMTSTMALSDEIKGLINKLKSLASTIDRILPDSLVPDFIIEIKNLDTADKEVTLKPSQLTIVSISDSRITGNVTGTVSSQFTFTTQADLTVDTSFSFTVQGMDEAGSTIIHRETIDATFIPVQGDECSLIGGEINSEGVCIVSTYWDNGTIMDEIPYVNGVIDGVRKYYYESGALWSESTYVNGIEHGTSKAYFESGALQFETSYVNGIEDGTSKEYYESGALRSEEPYLNGLKEGIDKTYYESGTLWIETPYTNDVVDGVSKRYYENGTLSYESPYIVGERQGTTKLYYESDGALMLETPYVNHLKNGTEKSYGSTGILLYEIPYVNGIKEGTSKYYNSQTGDLWYTQLFIDGIGESRIYY